MRTITKILSVILMLTLCLSAIATPALAAKTLPNEQIITVQCEQRDLENMCDFQLDKSCGVYLKKGGNIRQDAAATFWTFDVVSNDREEVMLEQTVEQTCKPETQVIKGLGVDTGETTTVTYYCNPGIEHFDLYIDRKRPLTMKNFCCSETNPDVCYHEPKSGNE